MKLLLAEDEKRMASALILLLAVTLTAIVLSEYYENRKQSSEMLERYVSLYSLDNPPNEEPGIPRDPDWIGPPDESSVFRLSTFYSAAISKQGEVLSVDAGQNGLYSESELIEIAKDILTTGGSSGKTGNLLYRVEVRDGYTLVAFMDNTVTDLSNAWFGVTITRKSELWRLQALKENVRAKHYHVTFEPLFDDPGEVDLTGIDWIVVGTMTGAMKKKVHTEPAWAYSLTKQAHALKIPVFMKEDLVSILGEENMIQELPAAFNKVMEEQKKWNSRSR